MIGSYINSDAGIDQWDIVKKYKGSSYPNEGGYDSEIVGAIGYATDNIVTYKSSSIISFSSHEDQIDNGYPVAIKMLWDNDGGARAMVCSGTKTSSGTDYLYLVDPWETTASTWVNYSALKSGTTISSGKGKYITSFLKK